MAKLFPDWVVAEMLSQMSTNITMSTNMARHTGSVPWRLRHDLPPRPGTVPMFQWDEHGVVEVVEVDDDVNDED